MWSSGAWRGAASQSAISLTFAAMAREHIHRAPCRSWPATKRWRGAMRARMPLGQNSPFFSHGALARMWSGGAWRSAASQSAISLTFAAMAREHIHRAPCRSWPATKRWRGAMRARMPLGQNSPFFSHGALARMWSGGAWRSAASQSAISLIFPEMARGYIYLAPCTYCPSSMSRCGATRARTPLGQNSAINFFLSCSC